MRFTMGQVMTQNFANVRTRSRRAAGALIFAGLLVAPAMLPGAANAQALGYAVHAAECVFRPTTSTADRPIRR